MPDSPEKPAGLPSTTRSLPIALIRARETVMAPIRAMLAETGLTEQQWRVLRVLSENGAMDASKLAARSSLLAPSLTRISQTMIDKGLMSREANDGDRRRLVLTITEAGQGVIDANLDAALAIVAGYRAQLGDHRYEQLLDLLAALDEGEG